MNKEEPDRVPMVLWGSYYTLNDGTYFNLLKHLGHSEPVDPFRKRLPRNSNYYDDRILDRLDTDARYVWSGFTDLGGARMDGDGLDAWGVRWERRGPNISSTASPLATATLDQVEGHDWPEPTRYMDFDLMERRIASLRRDYPSHAIGARAVTSYGPFEQASELRGREQLLMDTALQPEIAQRIIDRCTDVIVRGQEAYLECVGRDIDFFEIPGDDYGTNQSLMLSPAAFRAMIKPALARIVRSVKEYRSDLPVVFHSDGAITAIIPDLIEVGIDVLDPLEPLPATDWRTIKARYRHSLCFMGGVDIREAMTGPIEGVVEEVRRRIGIFGPGGGYILTAANHLQVDVPPENIVAMFDACRQFGRYPLALP
jgi:uroporphyrinogen decarboxylase